ncbi:MAG: type I methionyl aminopeptidase [Actinomycetota bacterium]
MAKRKRKGGTAVLAPRSDPPVQAGLVSPRRTVPASIQRPPYAVTGDPGPSISNVVRSNDEIAAMRRAGAAAAEVLLIAGEMVGPGVTTETIDARVHEEALARNAYPSPLNYRGFPKSVCTSINEVICHGIPDSRQLRDGDIINIDVTLFLDGVHGDTSCTFFVGDADDASTMLVVETRRSLYDAIDTVRPGAPFNAIGRAIENRAKASGLGVVRDFIGHGVGTEFHSNLQIPHYFHPRLTREMEVGMSFTIEPMLTLGAIDCHIWDDDWTAVTIDGRRTAQFEHTMVVTDDGVELTTVTSSGACAADYLA